MLSRTFSGMYSYFWMWRMSINATKWTFLTFCFCVPSLWPPLIPFPLSFCTWNSTWLGVKDLLFVLLGFPRHTSLRDRSPESSEPYVNLDSRRSLTRTTFEVHTFSFPGSHLRASHTPLVFFFCLLEEFLSHRYAVPRDETTCACFHLQRKLSEEISWRCFGFSNPLIASCISFRRSFIQQSMNFTVQYDDDNWNSFRASAWAQNSFLIPSSSVVSSGWNSSLSPWDSPLRFSLLSVDSRVRVGSGNSYSLPDIFAEPSATRNINYPSFFLVLSRLLSHSVFRDIFSDASHFFQFFNLSNQNIFFPKFSPRTKHVLEGFTKSSFILIFPVCQEVLVISQTAIALHRIHPLLIIRSRFQKKSWCPFFDSTCSSFCNSAYLWSMKCGCWMIPWWCFTIFAKF